MPGSVAGGADFCRIRYAQCWEDADVLLAGLDVQPGDTCLSIASAGDNTLSLLTRDPARVIALDVNPAQLACLELRVAAYRTLSHAELLALIGSSTTHGRAELYQRCRPCLSAAAREFWDAHRAEIEAGIGSAGKFERYFALFRTRVLPLVHGRARVERLLRGGDEEERRRFYEQEWDTWRWRLLFRVFFSRPVMGRLGRDPRFFLYVQGGVAGRILARTRHALTALDPSANPYLQWILTGRHATALPHALRPESFAAIRERLDRVEIRCCSLEEALDDLGEGAVERFNLSDIFEYMAPDAYEVLLARIARSARRGGRLAYWNMLAERRRPDSMADRLRPLDHLASGLHAQDKAFFYSAFVVEETL